MAEFKPANRRDTLKQGTLPCDSIPMEAILKFQGRDSEILDRKKFLFYHETFRPESVAYMLDVNTNTIRRWLKNGVIGGAVETPRRITLIRATAVFDFLDGKPSMPKI